MMDKSSKRLFLSVAVVSALFAPAFASAASAYTFGDLAAPGVYMGNGIPNGNWTIDTVGAVEIALRARDRSGVSPVVRSGNLYTVLGGAYPGGSGKAYWNYDFSVDSKVGGGGMDLTRYTVVLKFDTDPGAAAVYTTSSTFTNVETHWPDNAFWSSAGRRVGAGPALSGEFGVQNSENPKFADSGFGYVPGNGLYDIQMSVVDNSGWVPYTVGTTTIQVQVVPEPETYAMMLAGLGLLGFIARRRKQNLAAA
jgi:hypothetical protein